MLRSTVCTNATTVLSEDITTDDQTLFNTLIERLHQILHIFHFWCNFSMLFKAALLKVNCEEKILLQLLIGKTLFWTRLLLYCWCSCALHCLTVVYLSSSVKGSYSFVTSLHKISTVAKKDMHPNYLCEKFHNFIKSAQFFVNFWGCATILYCNEITMFWQTDTNNTGPQIYSIYSVRRPQNNVD